MSVIHILTSDNYFRLGLKYLLGDCKDFQNISFAILDDGVQYLYLIDTTLSSDMNLTFSKSIDYFLENVRLVMPKYVTPRKLNITLKIYVKGELHNSSLTENERIVLKDIACGIPSLISQRKFSMDYRQWHRYKSRAFKRIGISNTVSYMRVIHTWNMLVFHRARHNA
ncbi:hypothetical protein [Enterobacter hormaechei]|uniref:hypothetical protein n=1 Tax=Enterobacter hormaechei TaxID=158836 RepID=UPI002175C1F4|nr:hypothetical protein [Enterobacter hormaechei]UVZ93282.1 hypothetical protein M5T14_22300 [Enterobacter hormaechei]